MAQTAPARRITKVLVANRGEIAVRVIRAARDAGLYSVAVYAESDASAPFVEMADEAFSLNGSSAQETYLDAEKILEVAERSRADAVHPGYGFLSENADFAQAVIDAGLTWIGPSPAAIAALGDKVTAREIAKKADAPMVPGAQKPVANAAEAEAFAREHGLPIAIKAAFGGGGRGMKVARSLDEVAELFESATREAKAAFGRGECFIERYLDRARHVEAQVLADSFGNVVVCGTRDCTLQRRYQKLVEEAPAPFLSDAQRELIHSSAKRICALADYTGAGTVEYLVGADGLVSFLEVNTRLQVEHPVTELTSGIDLVREQFRIAEGQRLRFDHDLTARGHAFEFRINGEDPGNNFLPTPGTITSYREAAGPGVRVDSGVGNGSVISGQFDSMLAKLVVYGENRAEALQRARRALDEFQVEGIPTVLPFHRLVVNNPDFIGDEDGFGVSTRWIESEWQNPLEPFADPTDEPDGGETNPRHTAVVEVNGRRVVIALPETLALGGFSPRRATKKRRAGGSSATASGDAVLAPMQGTVVKVEVADGDEVEEGQMVLVLEAMKMENPVKAHKAGVVSGLSASPGDGVSKGEQLLEIK
ncbi:acetyl-COA carboxylase [Corynebacterium atypicum]|uniref:biotin carboxylase n=1 Tax=Corynebacterium atypicum TaxID=191610 RepID=A0ABM5QLT5_9CORY|nr:biotin carboxylase N-terminal domain-containing protein [Corynebacterium atypicum]AIG63755.1 acetyl-COA carboxylase [Corynebacterium atypicum]